ncbi:opsin-5-like [Pelobates fuscus]|uniref:opsin-5-like n=1 Tax=Pelobates fuscus TaxID=191477 RepID=UPI002FE4543B
MGVMENESFLSNIPQAADNTVGIIYLLFGMCSVFGNSLLLYISFTKRQLLKPAEYFIVNLAFSDLGMTVILYPLAITSSFSHRWIYGRHVCLFYAFCGVLFGICSLSTVTLLSIVCCVKVCFPAYGNRFGHKLGCILVTCAWVYAAIFAFLPLIHLGEYGLEPYGTACCIDWQSSNINRVAKYYIIALFVVCFIIPCGIIITSFTLILITVKESRKAVALHGAIPTRMSNVQNIIIKLSIAVCIGFFTAWSPYAIISMWATFGSIDIIPPLAFAVPSVFAKSSTIYNPIIYLLLKPNFRDILGQQLVALWELCTQCFVCLKPVLSCHIMSLHHKLFKKKNKSISYSKKSVGSYSFNTCETCKDTFEYFKHYPKCCSTQYSFGSELRQQDETKNSKNSIRVIVQGHNIADTDNFEITLEVIPECSKCTY